jgi:hypothetical protein
VGRHLQASDVALIVEISESSLARDRGIFAGLVDRRVEACSAPEGGVYQSVTLYPAGDSVPVVIDGVESGRIAVAALMPEPQTE